MAEPQSSCMDSSLFAGQIRLLRLEAGDGPQIKCHASVTEFSLAEPYEALSYTWGTDTNMETIFIDDRPFEVKQNLYAALLQLRSEKLDRIIWIDAICINQESDEERTMSVRMMGDVFARASRVLIWLGIETSTDKDAFSLFEMFENSFAKHGFFHVDNTETNDVVPGYEQMGLPTSEKKEWGAAATLFQRPYFSRMWIVQEVVRSTDAMVFCGPHTVKWETLLSVVRSVSVHGMMGYHQIEHTARGALSVTLMGDLKDSHDVQLLKVLVSTRHFKSTDPRDRIYAILGITTSPNQTGVIIDYALSTAEVFTSLATYNMLNVKSLAILGSAGLSKDSNTNSLLPTWVPNWAHDNDRRICLSITGAFKAAGNSSPVVSLSANQKVLTLRGIKVDSISNLTKTTRKYTEAQNPNEPEEMFGMIDVSQSRRRFEKKLTSESEQVSESCWNFPEGQTREDAFWRTVACDMTAGYKRMKNAHKAGYRFWQPYMAAMDSDGNVDQEKHMQGNSKVLEELGGLPPEYDEWMYAVTIHSVARNVCATAGGRMGLVSCETLPDDIVCVFLGGEVPFILRPTGDGLFKLVGECYIHGIMDGEVLSQENLAYDDFQII